MAAPSDIRRRFRLPAWIAAWGMMLAAALASGELPLGISAERDGDGAVRVSLRPMAPMPLAAGFEVRLPDGTLLEAESLPEPDVPGEFPAYAEAVEVAYALPEGEEAPESVLVPGQLCGEELCLMPETWMVPVGGGAAETAARRCSDEA